MKSTRTLMQHRYWLRTWKDKADYVRKRHRILNPSDIRRWNRNACANARSVFSQRNWKVQPCHRHNCTGYSPTAQLVSTECNNLRKETLGGFDKKAGASKNVPRGKEARSATRPRQTTTLEKNSIPAWTVLRTLDHPSKLTVENHKLNTLLYTYKS